MYRKSVLIVLGLFLLPALMFAADGKLRGKVTDRETREPLIGVTVMLEGTTLGAATDVNGDYIILGVPAGVYTVRVSYVGYATLTVTNIRISEGITTTQDFQLVSSSIQLEPIQVTAERPLVQRNTTNTVRVTTQEDIRAIPFRGVQNIIALNAGVVQKDGILYVRGGRAGEVAYLIDGVNVTNPLFRSENVSIIQEAVQELQLQSGGYTAEYGGANAGITLTTVRTGGSRYRVTADYQTDQFAPYGKQFLSTSVFGFRNGVLTVSGPITPDIRFFVAGQYNYYGNRQVMFLEPFQFDSLRTDNLGARPAGELLPGSVAFQRNYIPDNWYRSYTTQGTLTYDVTPAVKLRFTGSFSQDKYPGGHSWPGALNNIFWRRHTDNENRVFFGSLKATHLLAPSTYYDVAISYQNRSAKSYDPDFGDSWWLYADSIANAEKGFTGFTSRYAGPQPYSTIYAFGFTHPNAPINSYGKNSQVSIGASVDFTSQVNRQWELKFGGKLESWTMRAFGVGNISNYLVFLHGLYGTTPEPIFTSDQERRVQLARKGGIYPYGYDVDGNLVDSGPDGPRKPLFAAAYIQNKLEYNDLILNVGLRYELFDTKATKLPDDLKDNPPINTDLNLLDESKLVEAEAVGLLLPRISFSFPVTDRTVFYAQYGQFAQMIRLDQIYVNNVLLSAIVSPFSRVPYNLGGTVVGYYVKPERTTLYEVGFRNALTDNFAFTISGFYKDLRDQTQLRRILSSTGAPIFVGYVNEDFSTVKGVELTFELRRTNRLAFKVNYTLSDARGTGSSYRSSQNAVTDEISARFPLFVTPLDYNETHRGSAILDYRFAQNDGGPILEGMGLSAILTFNSGHNYTKVQEPRNLGQANPWNIGVRALIDSRSRNPVEPINASTTPWVFNIDLNFSKAFYFGNVMAEFYVNVLNLLNTKQILEFYPTTGTAEDDGWLRNPLAVSYAAIPNYTAFYNAINLQNRWAYMSIGAGGGLGQKAGGDLFGPPRQIRVGLRFEVML